MQSPSSPLPELPAIGFLAQVTAEHRAFLTGFGKFHHLAKGEVFVHQGNPQDSIGLVLTGTLHVLTSLDQKPLVLAELGESSVLGEINFFDPAAASASVVARGDCLIWSMTRGELEGLTKDDPEAGQSVLWGLLRHLSQRVRRMNEKLLEFRELSAKIAYESHPYEND